MKWTVSELKQMVIEIVAEYLAENLHIRVASGGFTDPNGRTINLMLGEKVISQADIDITQRREYEG